MEQPLRIYSNAIAIQGGAFDLAIDFGQRAGTDDPTFEARVFMSWEHAISLQAALTRVLDDYQEKVGRLPDVESLVQGEGTTT